MSAAALSRRVEAFSTAFRLTELQGSLELCPGVGLQAGCAIVFSFQLRSPWENLLEAGL
jgi:hypothetical protein